jgi:multiple sugar transport system permease protein
MEVEMRSEHINEQPTRRASTPRLFRPWQGSVLRWLVALIWLFVTLFPIYWLLNVVFSPPGSAVAIEPRLLPTSIGAGMGKFQEITADASFGQAYLVSFLYATLQILGILIVTSLAAYEFALFEFPGKNFLFLLALSSMMVPPAVTLIPLFRTVAWLGWLNSFQGLAIPGMASALSLFIMRQHMEDIPIDLIDAAEIDGASHFQTFRYVALPLAKNALVMVGIVAFVFTWSNFLWPLVVTNSPRMYTVSVLIAGLSASQSFTPIDKVIGAYFLAMLPPVLIYLFLQRFILESITLSGFE